MMPAQTQLKTAIPPSPDQRRAAANLHILGWEQMDEPTIRVAIAEAKLKIYGPNFVERKWCEDCDQFHEVEHGYSHQTIMARRKRRDEALKRKFQ